jgi:hypothetical protein
MQRSSALVYLRVDEENISDLNKTPTTATWSTSRPATPGRAPIKEQLRSRATFAKAFLAVKAIALLPKATMGP